jgi:hypothetical protein
MFRNLSSKWSNMKVIGIAEHLQFNFMNVGLGSWVFPRLYETL